MDQPEYDDLLRRLTALVVKLESTYDELVEGNRQQREFNRQQVEMNHRLETMIAHMLRQPDNGRNA